MPEIEIRPAVAEDIPQLVAFDHSYTSDIAWQMEVGRQSPMEGGQLEVHFREVRLPRSVRVEYPYNPNHLLNDWQLRSGLLVAFYAEQPCGYIGLALDHIPLTARVTDLVVVRRMRRQGIGSALVLAGQGWAYQHGERNILLEMQPKNYPAIQLAYKLGFDFSGYLDRYYSNRDTGLFFTKFLR